MSLGEIDKTYHKSDTINYVPLLDSKKFYFIKLDSLVVGDSDISAIQVPLVAKIDTGNTISYFPSIIFKKIMTQFKKYCYHHNNSCGNFTYEPDYGYCAYFPDRASLFTAVYKVWPDITLKFGDNEYKWKSINYYYKYNNTQRKACLGFQGFKSERVILGTNFIHGHDIIFDRTYKRLGIVPADCSRGNRIWHRNSLNKSLEFLEDPSLIDLEIHKNDVFNLGDNTQKDMVDFVEGHNTELEIGEEFKTVNFIIFLSSLIIVGIIVSIILFILFFNKKGNLKYEPREEVEYKVEQQNESNTSDDNNVDENGEENGDGEGENQDGDNKISFADNVNNSNENENNVEKEDDNNENDK